jgi:short-subunit dehydrogenase
LKVFITGASSGIGEALARRYAANGCSLGLHGRRLSVLQSLADDLGVHCSVHTCDVRDTKGMQEAGEAFLLQHGGVDLVIANAGVSSGTATERVEDDRVFREVFDSNVIGMVNTFRPFIPAMRERRQGKLVGIASVAGFRGLAGSGAYSASKAAAMTYLESLRVEMHGSGVRVITLCPGYIDTPMTRHNPYYMPFLLSAEDAAARMVRLIERNVRRAVTPWQMAAVGVVLRNLPDALFDHLFARAPRKPRSTNP